MSKVMKSVRIRIPGVWSDGWLYKESLVLWSLDGDLCFLPLSEIRGAVQREAGHQVAVASDYLIFRNDWKYSAQFTDLIRLPQVASGLFDFFGDDEVLTVAIRDSAVRSSGTTSHSGYVLDTEVYANRIYSASEEGLFETEFNPNFPETENPMLQTTDQPALAVAARSGKVAVSLGSEGLLTRDITLGHGDGWWSVAEQEKFETADDYSLGVSFSSFNLLNYRGEDAPHFLRAKTRRVPPQGNGQYDETVIDEYEPAVNLLAPVTQVLKSGDKVEIDDKSAIATHEGRGNIRVVGNSGYHLLVTDSDGSAVVNISAFDKKPLQLRQDPKFSQKRIDSSLVSEALSTQTLRSGFLLETFDKTGIITERGSHVLIDDSRVRIRSFPRSKRHHDCFLAVGEDFVELVGFIEIDA